MMEQTTKRLCPVCEKTLQAEDIIVDGYFDDILNSTPSSVENVTVETDGEWYTTDRKYGSATWRRNGGVPSGAEVIDLTRSDSDDDESSSLVRATSSRNLEISVCAWSLELRERREGRVRSISYQSVEITMSFGMSDLLRALGNVRI